MHGGGGEEEEKGVVEMNLDRYCSVLVIVIKRM